MRNIEFRGFRRKTQEWVYGYLVEREEPYLHDIIIPIGDSSSITYAVERESIGQYTGLKDKNGGEIYEGDIVKWGHLNQWSREQPHRIAEVKFNPNIQFHSQVGVFNFGSFAYRDTTETDLEVIGNIYENPELLKEQNK